MASVGAVARRIERRERRDDHKSRLNREPSRSRASNSNQKLPPLVILILVAYGLLEVYAVLLRVRIRVERRRRKVKAKAKAKANEKAAVAARASQIDSVRSPLSSLRAVRRR